MPRITVRPTALVSLFILAFAGTMIHRLAVSFEATDLSLLAYAGTFGATALGIVAVHELGHVLAGVSLGARWERITLGLGVSVSLSRHSNGEQIVVSLAGPAAHAVAVAAVLMWTQQTPSELGPASIAAWIMLLELALNMLPIRPLDGHRLFTAGWACLRGRSAETFAGTSKSEPRHQRQAITEEELCPHPTP